MLHWLKDSTSAFCPSTQTPLGQLIHPPTAAHLSMFRMEGNINPKPGSPINLSLPCWSRPISVLCGADADGESHPTVASQKPRWRTPHHDSWGHLGPAPQALQCRVSCYHLPCPIHCVLSTNLSVIFSSWQQQEFWTLGQLNSVTFCWVLKSLNVGIRVHYSPHSTVGGMAVPPPQQLLLYLEIKDFPTF